MRFDWAETKRRLLIFIVGLLCGAALALYFSDRDGQSRRPGPDALALCPPSPAPVVAPDCPVPPRSADIRADEKRAEALKFQELESREKQPAITPPAVPEPTPPAAPPPVPPAPPAGLLMPVDGVKPDELRDTFSETRGDGRVHDAIDILAPRGTRVFAVDDGRVVKLFSSEPGGLTVYQFDPAEKFAYYYAHLDAYAPGLAEGRELRRGELIGYVGSTGNAIESAPHLHFAIFVLGAEKRWWEGTAINPYPLLAGAQAGVD